MEKRGPIPYLMKIWHDNWILLDHFKILTRHTVPRMLSGLRYLSDELGGA